MECVSGFVNMAVHRGGAQVDPWGSEEAWPVRPWPLGLSLPDFGGGLPRQGAGRVWEREHCVPPRPWVCRPGWWGPESKPTAPL